MSKGRGLSAHQVSVLLAEHHGVERDRRWPIVIHASARAVHGVRATCNVAREYPVGAARIAHLSANLARQAVAQVIVVHRLGLIWLVLDARWRTAVWATRAGSAPLNVVDEAFQMEFVHALCLCDSLTGTNRLKADAAVNFHGIVDLHLRPRRNKRK